MKLTKWLIFIILHYTQFVSSQAESINYIDYHKQISAIESFIIDSSHVKAIEPYKKLFSKYNFVFAEDCFRAVQTAVFIGDFKSAFHFLERGVEQGVKIERTLSDSLLINLKDQVYWRQFEDKYDSLRNLYLKKINKELRLKINELHCLDQKHRDISQLQSWNFIRQYIIDKKWRKITAKIVEEELIPLIKKYGFPGEKLIGVDEKGFEYKVTMDRVRTTFAQTILIHYFSVPRTAEYNKLLFSSIRTGHISPSSYASIIDFQAQWGKNKYYKGLHYNEWHSSKKPKELPVINKNRISIGLPSIKQHQREVELARKAFFERKKGVYLNQVRFWHFRE